MGTPAMSIEPSGFVPGTWYFLFTCETCKTKQMLFPDLSEGTSKINATYTIVCPACRHEGRYDSEKLERYRHPRSQSESA